VSLIELDLNGPLRWPHRALGNLYCLYRIRITAWTE